MKFSYIMSRNLFIIVPIVVTLAIPITILGIVIYNALYEEPAGVKLVIDHDAGADDAIAIFMALLAEKYLDGPQVVALTTTHANVDEGQSYINSQRFLNVAKRLDVPIFRGTNLSIVKDMPPDHFFGIDGLSDMENIEYQEIRAEKMHAALALIDLSIKHKDELVIVAIGAATNIALAVRLDPEFLGRIKQLYIGSGHLYSKNFPEPEYNADQDVEGYLMAVRDAHPDQVTLLPYSQAIATMNVSLEWRKNVLGSIDTEIMRTLNGYEEVSWSKNENGVWSLLDPVMMAVFLEPRIVAETKYTNNGIILCGDKRGITVNNFVPKDEANAKLIYSLNDNIYKQYLYKVFSECSDSEY